jgi:UDP-N-acetylmuramoyl-tripeptide--D-alanyl-D-alanine ligase
MRAEGGQYLVGEIVRACGGVLLRGGSEIAFDGISTDSRDIRKNDLFIPIKGMNFDGHDFIVPALEAGALGSLINRDANREIFTVLSNQVLIQVQDTLQALSDLASTRRRKYPVTLVAVTGSSGKTTVKEMIAAILRRSHHLLVSQGNFNNMIGLPMTVLSLGPKHTAAVVEAGINTTGEMERLAHAARPNISVITTVGPVHLEGLGSIENVAAEKFKLAQALSSDGTAVVPYGNPYLEPLVEDCSCHVVTFGLEHGDFRASQINGRSENRFRIISPVGEQEIRLPAPGRHNISNALAATAAATAAGATLDDVAEALGAFTALSWRMEMVSLGEDRTLIRDCYNANPQSMQAALEVLAGQENGPTLAVIGNMAELGADAERLHEDLGKQVAKMRIDKFVFVGAFGTFFERGFVSAGGEEQNMTVVPDKEAAWDAIRPELSAFRAILIKGSRMMKMETLADRILEEN